MAVSRFSFAPSFSKNVSKIKTTFDEIVGHVNGSVPTLSGAGRLEGAGVDVVFAGTHRKNNVSGEIHGRRPWKVFYDDTSTINFNSTVGRAKYIIGGSTDNMTEGGPEHFYSFEYWFPISFSDTTSSSSLKVEWRYNDINQTNWENWYYCNSNMTNNRKYFIHGWGTKSFLSYNPTTFDAFSTGIYVDWGSITTDVQVAATSSTPIVLLVYDRGNSDEWGTDTLV